jgi:hypothetical protein
MGTTQLAYYQAFYAGKSHEFTAPDLYAAKQQAVKHFAVPKSKQGLLAVEFAGYVPNPPTMQEINEA